MRASFEELLTFLHSLSPSRITFNFNVSAVYADFPESPNLKASEVYGRLGMEEGERVECCGEVYDGVRLKGSFYTGLGLHLKEGLSWHRGTVEAFAILYDLGDVVIVEGRRRRAYRGRFRDRGNLHLFGWRYAALPGGGAFYTNAARGTRRFALTPSGFLKLGFPRGFNVLVRIYEEIGDWQGEVRRALGVGGVEVRSPGEGALRVGRYIVKVLGDDLLIVHEGRATFRVLYEKLLRGEVRGRRLLMPVKVGEVKPEVAAALRRVGFRFEGNRLVEAPDFLRVIDPATVSSLLKGVSGTEGDEALALKVASLLSGSLHLEPEDLIINLMLCNNPYQDPEGRVIVRRITAKELDSLLQ